ncbi:hypothetical protein B0T26DRAFT_444813 [Lasiosphaeria miniovina]|uniref:Rhodopsin domain-containing protein n=1 Tax=Lasiosphaeria miniovina TaxID=1954250 RepID=A0AA40DMF8_9PEZI|nr:uncharacterized protein B0T26DRAFT_444813 [Lasiosphaeria miniovina]KAK0706177.1 hypothetical protein B0T26DRAFT_444813 [Lasiosphaeria miniovina]
MHAGLSLAVTVWVLTGISLLLLALRLYTRLRIVRFVGAEDYLYVCTGVFLLAFAGCLQVAVYYGLGRSFWTLSVDDSSRAIFWTYVANTFAIAGNAMAKLSMGFFLLRVVQLRGQKAALWLLIVVTAGTSFALVVMLWNQTTPRKASWDPLRTPGKWNIQIQPMSVGLGGWSSACDFFFAIFPWIFIWSLRMPRRDKIMLAGGMSLGVIAGACGIIRTVVLSRLDIMDYTLNFAPYFVWAGAEIAVAMVCLGIPTLRPLYLKHRGRSIGYGDRQHSHASDPELPQFDMVDQKHAGPSQGPQLGEQGPIPHDHKRQDHKQDHKQQIILPASPPPSYVRDSTSSHTVVEPEPSPEPLPELAKPLNVYSRGRDSVDDILGLYDAERSRSRGRTVSRGNHSNKSSSSNNSKTSLYAPGVIWVRNEVLVEVEHDYRNWPLKN